MPSDRRNRKKQQTHKALLDAALAIFAKEGIYAPTIEEITEAADVAKGTFYNYFDARDDLIAALVHQAFDLLLHDLDRGMKAAQTGESLLRLLLKAHTEFFREHPDYFLVLHQARGWLMLTHDKNELIRVEYARYVDHLAESVGRTLWGRRQRPAQLHRTARAIAGYCAGVMSFELILGGRQPKAIDLTVELQHLSSLM